jgi:hypothetical protein
MDSERRFAFALILLLSGLSFPAAANLTGLPAVPPPLTATEHDILAHNPDLSALAADHPWVLRAVLDELAAPPIAGSKATISIDADEMVILRTNPALMVVYNAAPDAAADLLALIRSAAGKGK